MKNKYYALLSYFDNLNFNYKTAFLVFIIAGGMICIIILSQISIFTMKQDFNILFDKRTKSLMQLENIKDSYKVNIQDSLIDLEKKQINYEQTIEVLTLAQEIIDKNWSMYQEQTQLQNKELLTTFIKTFIIKEENYYENNTLKNSLIKNIDKKKELIKNEIIFVSLMKNANYFENLNLEINAISIYLTSLINYDLNLAINEKRNTDKIFNTIIIFSIISIFIVFLFSVILSLLIIDNFRKLHNSLEQKVNEKTKELQKLNTYLETKISKEVAQNRKKDIIMFQQARFASLGEMLNNIAHQWRQPLGSITMIIQSFQTKMSLGKLTSEFMDEKVNDALLLASNMSNTLDDFKNFFSPNKIKSEFNINCIEHSIELSKYLLIQENIEVKLTVRKDVKINSYYNELSHVFLNIISNSKDALCSNVDKNDRIIKIIVNKFKNHLVVNMVDNGGGIPKDILPKIFEPYYTTKYKSAGTGIGLYMSKQIIEKHMNGEISCKNIIHKMKNEKIFNCSLFTIKIPLENENKEKTNDK